MVIVDRHIDDALREIMLRVCEHETVLIMYQFEQHGLSGILGPDGSGVVGGPVELHDAEVLNEDRVLSGKHEAQTDQDPALVPLPVFVEDRFATVLHIVPFAKEAVEFHFPDGRRGFIGRAGCRIMLLPARGQYDGQDGE